MVRILLAVDGSECSQRAVAHGAAMAKHLRSLRVHILNVQEMPIVPDIIARYVSKAEFEHDIHRRGNPIVRAALEVLHEVRIPCRTSIHVGDAASMIASEAERLKCDSILMGSHGRGAVGNLVIGSVASKVVHLTDLPVIIVR